ncbi:hypothetical protein NP493_120g00035 [Ridgeia piscesae]|uniref:Uncharacterized protein n=1 Tax=Ridgeia piscesae TaxID=27915 RepID=A0AAD9P656_RIDPI|nr:hypothetical protein NP493_120g00035 [Ridgeia piscesae]
MTSNIKCSKHNARLVIDVVLHDIHVVVVHEYLSVVASTLVKVVLHVFNLRLVVRRCFRSQRFLLSVSLLHGFSVQVSNVFVRIIVDSGRRCLIPLLVGIQYGGRLCCVKCLPTRMYTICICVVHFYRFEWSVCSIVGPSCVVVG